MNEYGNYKDYLDLLEKLFDQLDHLPLDLGKKIKVDIDNLISFVRDKRPPRFMVLGRRGAGKSQLINAIFGRRVRVTGNRGMTGKAKWEPYERIGTDLVMDILDTRGYGEGGKPLEKDDEPTPKASVLEALKEKRPDIILYTCKATDIDSFINQDLATLEDLLKEIKKIYRINLPILAIATQCDQLDPLDVDNLPTDNIEMIENIEMIVNLFHENINKSEYIKSSVVGVIPVSAKLTFVSKEMGSTIKDDFRWNIVELERILLEVLPNEAKFDFVRVSQVYEFQREIASKVVESCAVVCGGIGTLTPFPAVDLPIITGIQLMMVTSIAYISGREVNEKTAMEFLAGVGIGVVGRAALREITGLILDFVPVFGDAAAGLLDYAATKAVGEAAIVYFIDNSPMNQAKDKLKKDFEKYNNK